MKRLCLMVAAVGLIFCMGGAFAQAPPPSAQHQIEAAITKMKRAAQAHDTDVFMTAYQRSPDLIFVINGQVIHGWKALHAQQLVWWRGGKSDVVYTDTAPTQFTQLAPDVWVSTRTISSRRTGADGKPSVGHFAVTEIWRKFPEGWRIVYGHESWAKPPSR